MSASRFFLCAVVERPASVQQVVRYILDWRHLQYRDACVCVCGEVFPLQAPLWLRGWVEV